MRFSQKIIISSIIIFALCITISAMSMANRYNDLIIERELVISDNEAMFIANTLANEFDAYKSRGGVPSQNLYDTVTDYYKKFYGNQGVDIELIHDGISETVNYKLSNSESYIEIIKTLPNNYNDLSLKYTRDISSIYILQKEWQNYYTKLIVVTFVIFTFLLNIFIKKILNKINILAEKTDRFTNGHFDEVINLSGQDEVNELAEKFNVLARTIENKINELENAKDEKQDLIDSIAHELRTPLTAVQGFSDMLLTVNMNESETHKALSFINSESIRLKNLINKLLEISVLTHDNINKTNVDVSNLVEKIKKLEFIRLKEKNINLVFDVEVKQIYADENFILLLLINLIDNSINASDENSNIEVKFYSDKKYHISIRDYGIGIAENEIKNILEPFYRVNKSRSRKHGGAGLGLSLCKKIIDAHDGQLDIISTLGEGTNVLIILQDFNNSIKY